MADIDKLVRELIDPKLGKLPDEEPLLLTEFQRTLDFNISDYLSANHPLLKKSEQEPAMLVEFDPALVEENHYR